MSVYLHDIPLPEARSRLEQALAEVKLWQVLGRETIPLDEHALGRVLAEPLWARSSSPHYHASAMDGFAVRAEDTAGAQPSKPVTLSGSQHICYLDTGEPIPEGFDAVIPIENVESLDDNGELASIQHKPAAIRIRAAVTPWSHVRSLGEDIVATQLVLPDGHRLRAVDLGAAAAAGYGEVQVARKPRVGIIPTGTELVPLGSVLRAGDILEFNSLVLAAQLIDMGAETTRFPIIPDDMDVICEQVLTAAQNHDLVLLIAGSSAGAEDYSAQVVDQLGKLLVHGVAVRPGHPVILGILPGDQCSKQPGVISKAIPVVGVPGYPVSAALTIDIFVEPLIARWLGRLPKVLPVEKARLTRKLTSPAGDEDHIRVVVGRVGDTLLAAPLLRGAGMISSLVRADGLVILPVGVQGVEAGEEVDVHLYRSKSEIEKTIFCIGSHDLTLDMLSRFLAVRDRRFVSSNVGSQAGLVALKRGEAHLAGSHLLDPETGDYNLPDIRKYLPDTAVKVMYFVGRQQGLMVKKGNPKAIRDLSDLVRPDVRFVNRQRGAGTRVLLDYQLNQNGVLPRQIQGYNQEEYTHLNVAAAVASGRSDCGLGIAAAAFVLDLDFIPLFRERYDLIIPVRFADEILLAPLFDVIASSSFQEAVSALPGYEISEMGTMMTVED
ncbi:MAG: molybdopterin biosynthesis protein [Anaerolineales bacterium]|nr:molybdopterin biosynthesis protein [Anaerolineales bacterium]